MGKKIEFNPDKMSWHPSPLAGQIVLLTTVDSKGNVDVAPKSWITMISFKPPSLVIGCNKKHTTAMNLTEVPEFVVNIPSENLVHKIYHMPAIPSPRSPESLGLGTLSSFSVKPPSIAECFAHLECKLIKTEGVGNEDEILIFGEVVKSRIDADAREGSYINRYSDLRPVFFLEDGTYGVIDLARSIGSAFTDLNCVVVTLSDLKDVSEYFPDHLAYLKELQREGNLIASGSFSGELSGGMYVLRAASNKDIAAIVENDPLVSNKVSAYSLQKWHRSY
jgi:flavin reductase (DIM6/NTAB) family NADH-FMN oxidoreductase RutF/uncharacterized protein YciI